MSQSSKNPLDPCMVYFPNIYQILQVVTPFGPMLVTLFQGLSDLYTGNQRVTLKKQVVDF